MVVQKLHRLVVVDGLNIGESYILQDMRCTIGRANDNVIVINSPSISRYHAQIALTLSGPQVEDLNSTNGTFVNGDEITRPVVISPGDVVTLADTTTLRYVVEADEATAHMAEPAGPAATVIESPAFQAYAPPAYAPPAYTPPAMEYTPPPPPVAEPAYQEISFGDARTVNYTPPPEATPYMEPLPDIGGVEKPKKRTLLYIVIAVLAVFICLCVIAAVYMWFAPREFWENLFDTLGIPLPAAMLFAQLRIWLH